MKEIRDQEESSMFKYRTGRLDKWKEVAREAVPENTVVEIPDKIENLI